MGCVTSHSSCARHLALAPAPSLGSPFLLLPGRALRSEEVEPKRREEGPSGLRSPKMGINRDSSGQRDGAEREGRGCKGLKTEKLRRGRGDRERTERQTQADNAGCHPKNIPRPQNAGGLSQVRAYTRDFAPGCLAESCEPLVASELLCTGGSHQHFQKGDTQVPPAAGSFPTGTDPAHTPGVFQGPEASSGSEEVTRGQQPHLGKQRERKTLWARHGWTHRRGLGWPKPEPPTPEGLEGGEAFLPFYFPGLSPAQTPSVSPHCLSGFLILQPGFTFSFWPNQKHREIR